jgi:DNA helicase-2/ATP-dependent DNA helicase PcrA
MPTTETFEKAFEALNASQKKAVETIEGPVMVVAGPGTGKTQVLALRIAHILKITDTPPSGILCLTFTNAGVRAMRERLLRLIGTRGSEVHVSTFHRFAISLIEKNFTLLDFETTPTLLGETEAVALVDEILEAGVWQYIRPRGNATKYFSDLKSLLSLLKRESMSPADFLSEVETEIDSLRTSPESISSRGTRKGELKKEVEKQIESLERTKEVVRFYELYESKKRERALMDYDDVLAYAVILANSSEDVRDTLRENYLYVLVDEHQDSSGVQNAFLEAIWGETESPNIFVVGDDRQLIYGFGGASLEHFTRFRKLFGKAVEITLTDNYRSTQTILDAADALLSSTLATGKLQSNHKKKAGEKITILECGYPRDEIIAATLDIKKKISEGLLPEDCAILVPKNYQVRSAVEILRDHGLSVAAGDTLSFFTVPETSTVRNMLHVLADPYNAAALGNLVLDPVLAVPPLEAHAFLRNVNTRKLSLEDVLVRARTVLATDPIASLGLLLEDLLSCSQTLGLSGLIQKIGEDVFFKSSTNHEVLIRQVEVIRTFIHLLSAERERNPNLALPEFLAYLDRLEEYGHTIPLAVFSAEKGIRVLTLHGSKGLEFRAVYIAHLDDASLMHGKRMGFTLPESLEARIEVKDELVARRELYVAITRAKEYCTISYPLHAYSGAELIPARILADLPEDLVTRRTISETEAALLSPDPKVYVKRSEIKPKIDLKELTDIVASEYMKTSVSVTLLNNFFGCPWKWYFRSLLQVPELKTESLITGSVVHASIEYLLKHKGKSSEKELEEVMLTTMEKEYVCSDTMRERIVRETKAILAVFTETYLPRIAPNAVSERSLIYRDPKFGHLTCYGKIDLTERDPSGLVHVTDFKTGSAKSARIIEKLDEEGRMSGLLRQLAMYAFLIRGAEKGTQVGESKLLFLEASPKESEAVYTKNISEEEISLLRKDITDYDALVSSGEWVARPCIAVSYGKNSECEYCAKAKALYL